MNESVHAPPVAVAVVPEKSLEIVLSSSAVPEKVTLVVLKLASTAGELTVGAAGAVVSLVRDATFLIKLVTVSITDVDGGGSALPLESTFGLLVVG